MLTSARVSEALTSSCVSEALTSRRRAAGTLFGGVGDNCLRVSEALTPVAEVLASDAELHSALASFPMPTSSASCLRLMLGAANTTLPLEPRRDFSVSRSACMNGAR